MEDVMDKPTTSPISTRKHGDVLIVLSNNPPVNALGHAVRQGLVAAVDEAEADDSVKAVVIACEGQTFFAGADVSEFGTPKAFEQPVLPQVVDRIERCTKPVVAAIHGTALGGGLEVALSCHYRVALPSAKLGTPEVKLGLLPGAGGTQRLPRVAGVRKALEMCATGNPIGAKDGFACGLIDRLIEGVLAGIDDVRLNGATGGGRLPGNSHFTFRGCEGDSLLMLMDAKGVECSTGSACTAGVAQPSHVLIAMGADPASARGSLRLSLGHTSTEGDVEAALEVLPAAVERARQAALASSGVVD
jgi:enoyl-CoA hydratase/carnithine racemase